MGASVMNRMISDNPMVIDYASNGMRSDFMDIYLGANCKFCISNGTGFDAVPYIFRRPILYVDHVPLGIINTFSSRFMATTKKHWLISENRELSLEEILQNDVCFYTKSQDYELAGIELRESSPNDIKQVVIEMEERLSGDWIATEEDENLQAYFWSIFPKNHLHGEIRSRVGTHFLKKIVKSSYKFSKYNLNMKI
jgi:putative glycosyltransferase (TIGR04372 family)